MAYVAPKFEVAPDGVSMENIGINPGDYNYSTTTAAVKPQPVQTTETTVPTPAKSAQPAPATVAGAESYGMTAGADGSPDMSGLDISGGTAAIQGAAADLSADSSTSASSIVSSSAPVVTQERIISDDVRKLGIAVPGTGEDDARAASERYMAELDRQTKEFEQRRSSQIEQIEANYAGAREGMVEAQKNETGTFNASLARIGGYLGGSMSHIGAQIKLAQSHRSELAALFNKKEALIAEANYAIDDKQFALAKAKVQEVKDLEKEIVSRKDKYFSQQLQLAEEERKSDQYYREKIQDDLAAFAMVDPATIDPNRLAEIDEFYGVQGFSKKYLEVTAAASAAKSQKEIIATQKSLLDLLQDIPKGQTVSFPDGTTYTGMGSVNDVSTYQVTDDFGNVRIVAYDKGANTVTSVNLGGIGKTDSSSGGGGGGGTSGRVTEAGQALDALKDPATGNVPVDAYIEMYRAYVVENNGRGEEFIKNFDPLIYTGKKRDALRLATPTSEDEDE